MAQEKKYTIKTFTDEERNLIENTVFSATGMAATTPGFLKFFQIFNILSKQLEEEKKKTKQLWAENTQLAKYAQTLENQIGDYNRQPVATKSPAGDKPETTVEKPETAAPPTDISGDISVSLKDMWLKNKKNAYLLFVVGFVFLFFLISRIGENETITTTTATTTATAAPPTDTVFSTSLDVEKAIREMQNTLHAINSTSGE
jgi:hypothetical protein